MFWFHDGKGDPFSYSRASESMLGLIKLEILNIIV